jgi:gamma-glutamylcyclotransferase (GGCT)/AIG2-like uncharacterized protein YtfP
MTAPITFLFVYGTLLSTAAGTLGRAQRQRLARECAPAIRAGTVPGRLYDLGRYPGLVETGSASEIVHGEVLELTDPERTLRWLDAYEGIVPGAHPHNEYERCERPVTLTATGESVTAWVYLYRRDASHARLIADGRWLPTLPPSST